ncbi:LysR family transcriptional regulator [Labrys okinawensis]|uniref:LysR family transcriptional regulator n=1 Tax=Labrys okinawensis TaxID=346911 RepID=UPI0039BD38C3
MSRFDDLEVFSAIVDAGGISAAAAALGSSPPAVSRRLAALEARLGVRLAERSARRFRLTDEGTLYHARGQGLLAELRDAEAEVTKRGDIARGLLKVGAPMELGRRRIAPLLADFAALHPGLEVHLLLSDAGIEVGEEGLDVALRFGRPADPSLIARRIATVRRIVCASPSYLATHGIPARPDDLTRHDCLRLARRHRLLDQWRFRVEDEERIIKVSGTLSSTSGDVLHGWVLAGRGLSLEALWDVEDDLAGGRLVECLAPFWCDSIDLFATFLPGKPLPPRIRLFIDFIAAAFAR